jgi:hypothetical protein
MPDTTSLARLLYEKIIGDANPANFIRGFVSSTPPTREEEWLDFKLFVNDNDVKETWSTVLSGFANTGGGVLVWGIDARKGPDGIDAACAAVPIAEPSKLVSRLKELHRVATDPPTIGVEIREFLDAGSSEGFVVCHVPESKSKPHRAEHVKNKPYYIRAGDSFTVAPPPLLRSLFYPKTSAKLRVSVVPCWDEWDGVRFAPFPRLKFSLEIENDGTATARDVFVTVHPLGDMQLNVEPFWVKRNSLKGPGIAYAEPLHPGMAVGMCWISYLPAQDQYTFHDADRNKPLPVAPVEIRLALYCLDQDQQLVRATIRDVDFINPRKILADWE